MDRLLAQIRLHFDGLEDRLLCFHDQEVQVESWFKGELLFLLSRLRQEGVIDSFEREVRTGRGNVDLMVKISDVTHWIELKHWLVGVQRGARLDPPFYFGDPTTVGVIKDFDKLSGIAIPDQKWLLILLTRNPGKESWERGLSTFHRKFPPRKLVPYLQPDRFPSSYFLGFLQIVGNEASDP